MNRAIDISVAVVALVLISGARGQAQTVAEPFENPATSWAVTRTSTGGGQVTQTTTHASSGANAARLSTSGAGGTAYVSVPFSDASTSHTWNERPGTYRWQRARVYVPSTTIAQLGSGSAFTLAAHWPSADPNHGWHLRVRNGGQVYVQGARDWDGAVIEFPVYATIPTDRWFTLEIGVHSQAGPGVKRAFAFFIDGVAHGWYHQGHFNNTYDRSGMGVISATSATNLEVFVDDWGVAGTSAFPTGPDLRSTDALQTIDYRSVNGANWQIDWTTWSNNLRLHPTAGLYSDSDRLQSGRNLDRAPSLTSGWAEIEVDWPKGQPSTQPNQWFGPMVGFRKEINREQNLEVVPVGRGDGNVDLALEAWDGNGPVLFGTWPLPSASIGGTSIPEPGDIIRVRWEQVSSTDLAIAVHYYDASAATWHNGVIAGTYNVSSINGIDFTDGFHQASSVTIDSPFYSIRRFHAGTLASYPGGSGSGCTYGVAPTSLSIPAAGGSANVTVTAGNGCSWTATASAPWLSRTPASGSGNSTVTVSATANASSSARTGTVTIAGTTVTVTQAAQADTTAPAISGVSATATGHTTATIAWTTNEPATSQVSYGVGSPSSATGLSATLVTSHSVQLTGLQPGTAYVAVARSQDAAGNLGTSGTVSFSTPALPTLAVNDVSALEGSGTGGTAQFTVTLSTASTATVTVAYATANGSAAAPGDFAAASGTVTFSPGSTAQTVSISLVGDTAVEPNETFSLVLSSPTGATLADATGGATITNDDVNTPAPPLTATFQVASGADDVNQHSAFGAAGTTTWVGSSAVSQAYTAYRFIGVTIPRNATIMSARLEVRSAATQRTNIAYQYSIEAAGNSAEFSASNPPAARTLLPARVDHASNTRWTADTAYVLDEIAPILQQLVNRQDWASGNALSVILRGAGNQNRTKTVRAFEAGAALAPRLVVTYTVP